MIRKEKRQELRIGPWVARHRKEFFLATKTGSRSATEAREEIDRSLERLRVDHVDLIQLHSLGHLDDWDQAMGRTHTTWYQPLEAQADIDRAIHSTMGLLANVFINTAGDLTLPPSILDAVSRFERRPSDGEMAKMLGAVRMTSLFGLPT